MDNFFKEIVMFKHAKCYRINIPISKLEIGKPPSGKPQIKHRYLRKRTVDTKFKRPLFNNNSYRMSARNRTMSILSRCNIKQWKKTK